MSKRGMPGLASGDTKAPSPLSAGHKSLRQKVLPSPREQAQLVGGDAAQRTLVNYSKQSPAGAPMVGPNINTMAGAIPGVISA